MEDILKFGSFEKSGKNFIGIINKEKVEEIEGDIFTNKYDEIKKAEELENEEEIIRLRKNLDQQLVNLQNLIAKLANKDPSIFVTTVTKTWGGNPTLGPNIFPTGNPNAPKKPHET